LGITKRDLSRLSGGPNLNFCLVTFYQQTHLRFLQTACCVRRPPFGSRSGKFQVEEPASLWPSAGPLVRACPRSLSPPVACFDGARPMAHENEESLHDRHPVIYRERRFARFESSSVSVPRIPGSTEPGRVCCVINQPPAAPASSSSTPPPPPPTHPPPSPPPPPPPTPPTPPPTPPPPPPPPPPPHPPTPPPPPHPPTPPTCPPSRRRPCRSASPARLERPGPRTNSPG